MRWIDKARKLKGKVSGKLTYTVYETRGRICGEGQTWVVEQYEGHGTITDLSLMLLEFLRKAPYAATITSYCDKIFEEYVCEVAWKLCIENEYYYEKKIIAKLVAEKK